MSASLPCRTSMLPLALAIGIQVTAAPPAPPATSIISITVDTAARRPFSTAITLDGRDYTLQLAPVSVRSPGYRLLVQGADGSLCATQPSPEKTVHGRLIEEPTSRAAGSVLADGLHVSIDLGGGDRYWIEPLSSRIAGAAARQHVVYRESDVIRGGVCGTDTALSTLTKTPPPKSRGGINGCSITELFCDTDYEYFQLFGSVQATEDRINFIINTMNLQYEREVFISYVIDGIVVRTDINDPYEELVPFPFLLEFKSYWNQPPPPPGDVRLMFTARALPQSSYGLALAGVCTNNGFAYARTEILGYDAFATSICAHELGHVWGAGHCCISTTMNAGVRGYNSFAAQSIYEIDLGRDSANCLDTSCPGDFDCDGVVDVRDWLILLAEWGICQSFQPPGDPQVPTIPLPCRADLNDDDTVDVLDQGTLFSVWGPCR